MKYEDLQCLAEELQDTENKISFVEDAIKNGVNFLVTTCDRASTNRAAAHIPAPAALLIMRDELARLEARRQSIIQQIKTL